MAYAIPPWQPPAVAIDGAAELYPVRRIYCVGRNYAAHAREMGHDPDREPPFFFMKPADAVIPDGAAMAYPPATSELHHEIELVVAIGGAGRDIPADRALEHVFGYAVGLDMTRRDLQSQAKKLGRPWDMGKGFDQSAPCGAIRPAARVGHPDRGAIWLEVNGEIRQKADLADLIWSVPETIAYLSGLVELRPGDLIYTGTPEGIGPVARGDRLRGHVDGLGELSITIG
ncbi:fumarylacetoacetate hydrolase family protein [Arenibaculum sp.]|uniref:fumarylacetoacetate hydrolase family protein n=1 Tax=Arenibaculum sp. TaxID=2865862 RepID=UPI002E12FE57|nr:fumarylacetoacetate hydrolase family protein [Arenibaculum sp.]